MDSVRCWQALLTPIPASCLLPEAADGACCMLWLASLKPRSFRNQHSNLPSIIAKVT